MSSSKKRRGYLFFLIMFTMAESMSLEKKPGQLRVKTISNIRPIEEVEEEDSIDIKEAESILNEDIWARMFPDNPVINETSLLPKTVYDFQTGELSHFNTDLNGSTSNQLVTSEEAPLHVIDDEKPRKYSSKYAKENSNDEEKDGDFSHDHDFKVLEDGLDKAGERLKPDENEQYEVYEKLKKEASTTDQQKAATEDQQKAASGGGGGGHGGNKKHSEGKGEEHHIDNHSKKDTKGVKDYKGEHHYHKGEKGHHDKEGHKGEYGDKKGSKKAHKEGGGHFEAGLHGEKGEKDAKHSDKEEYKKGHSTRGGHVVHKKDEYEKKHEFYDEHHEGGEGEKHGEFFEEHHAKSGGHKKGGHKHGGEAGDHKGKKGKYEKGHKFHEQKGHKKAGGHEEKHAHDEKYGKKGGHSDWKKFSYDNGKGGGGGGGGGGKGHLQHANSDAAHILQLPPREITVPKIDEVSALIQNAHLIRLPPRELVAPKIDEGESRPVHEYQTAEEVNERPALIDGSNLHLLRLTDTVAAENRPPVPSTELRPPPLLPQVIVSQYRFPPIATAE